MWGSNPRHLHYQHEALTDYLSLERSKGGYENILVITDHYTRYAQAIPTRNQTAQITEKALFENFFLHYGFPARIHSDQGANFESKLIQSLCSLTGMRKNTDDPIPSYGEWHGREAHQDIVEYVRNPRRRSEVGLEDPCLDHDPCI